VQSLVVQRADRPVVATLAPLFALITASTIMALTYARALFLEHRPHADLPWMYVMAAVFTALCTIGYLPLMKRWELTSRFRALLGLAAVSFVGLGLAARTSPVAIAMLLFAWTAGMSRLLVMQMWSYSVWLLPIRQARHLFPLLAAAATAGAMAGGALSAAIAPDTLLYLLRPCCWPLPSSLWAGHLSAWPKRSWAPTPVTKPALCSAPARRAGWWERGVL